jgi:type IV pilus assembly protein PilV
MNEGMKMRKQLQAPGRERGVMLIEALIAILIFSIGILAVVGMQSVAIRNVTESKHRSEAAFLVSELTSQMWTDAINIGQYSYPGSGSVPAKLVNWMARVDANLPGATVTRPKVTVTPPAPIVPPLPIPPVGATVTIELFWQLPEEASAGLPPRNYTVVSSIFTF